MKTGIEFAVNLFDNGLDALALLDDNLCVTYWNPEMASLSSVVSERAVGAAIHDLFPATASAASRFLRRSLAGECLIADAVDRLGQVRHPVMHGKEEGNQWGTHQKLSGPEPMPIVRTARSRSTSTARRRF